MGKRGPKPHPERDAILAEWQERGATWAAAVDVGDAHEVSPKTIMSWVSRLNLPRATDETRETIADVRRERDELRDEVIELYRENRRLLRLLRGPEGEDEES